MSEATVHGQSRGGGLRWAGAVRWASILLILVSLLLIMRQLPLAELLNSFEGVVRSLGVWGPVAYGLLYVVAVVLLIPGSLITLAGGAIFGLFTGTFIVSLGATTGFALTFLISRYLARKRVEAMVADSPKLAAIDKAITRGGWKIVLLLRLSPAVPFNLQNYLYGITGIRFWPAILASWVGMLPGTFLFVYLGHIGRAGLEAAASDQDSGRTWQEWAFLGLGLLATVVVTVYVTKLARRALKEAAETPEEAASHIKGDPATPAKKPGFPFGTAALAFLALVLVGGAVFTQVKPDFIRTQLTGLLGPPAVTMREAYEPDPDSPDVDHSEFDGLLKKHVNSRGGVDYVGLREDSRRLDEYLNVIENAPFQEMGRDQKLALLINAYNAFTLKLILEHYPSGSIKDIPSEARWEAERWNVGGNVWSLNQIEHEQIRPKFKEPRIHFALVCAAVGCPPLRAEAYTAERIDEQLQDQAEYAHKHDRWFRYETGGATASLTKLYDWYGGDFEQAAGSVLKYAAGYSDALEESLESGRAPEIDWLPYSWKLNSQENVPE